MLILHGYYRSSAAYRVRIALHYKNLAHQHQAVHLVKNGGEQFFSEYRQLNPQSLVPTLQDGDTIVTQSLAIIEYLEETYPLPSLLPTDPTARALVRSYAQIIACDIHPLNNLRVLQYLQQTLAVTDEQKQAWYQQWILQGFAALETRLAAEKCYGKCCFGDLPTIADLCLIPQIYNAQRFHCAMDDFPIMMAINDYCLSLPAFEKAIPENQA